MASSTSREQSTESSVAQFATTANQQLKAAGVDTEVMVNRAGELQQMLKDEISARPFQAIAIAAFVGFVWGLRR